MVTCQPILRQFLTCCKKKNRIIVGFLRPEIDSIFKVSFTIAFYHRREMSAGEGLKYQTHAMSAK